MGAPEETRLHRDCAAQQRAAGVQAKQEALRVGSVSDLASVLAKEVEHVPESHMHEKPR